MRVISLVGALALLAGGCAGMMTTAAMTATAEMKNAAGQVVGSTTLTEEGGGMRIVVEVRGLPAGVKGVHIHEVGTCEGPAFTSAGGHFNPMRKQHGTMNPQGAHAGDLPNLTVAPDGTGRLETTAPVTLGSGPTSLFDDNGSAVVVHAAPDDLRTDPTGNSGARIACGPILKR